MLKTVRYAAAVGKKMLFTRFKSSSSYAIECDPNTLIMDAAVKDKLKSLEVCKVYSDMSQKMTGTAFAGEAYNEADELLGAHQGTLERHVDTCCLEMRGSLDTIEWFSKKYPDMKHLLAVTDSQEAYNHLTGKTKVTSKEKHYSRYKKREKKLQMLKKKFHFLEFALASGKNPKIVRVDQAAKALVDSKKN